MVNAFNGSAGHLSVCDQVNIMRIMQCIGEVDKLQLTKNSSINKILVEMNPRLNNNESSKPAQKIDMRQRLK